MIEIHHKISHQDPTCHLDSNNIKNIFLTTVDYIGIACTIKIRGNKYIILTMNVSQH